VKDEAQHSRIFSKEWTREAQAAAYVDHRDASAVFKWHDE